MGSTATTCSAFLDLVGIKTLAERSPERYWDSLYEFQMRLVEISGRLSNGRGRIYFFSDCAYVESKSIKDMLLFLRAIRHYLLKEGLYFKGAVDIGALDARDACEAPEMHDPTELEKLKKTHPITGHWFGKDAARLYGMQESFKGIGFFVSPRLVNDMTEQLRAEHIVPSCYVSQSNTRNASTYFDIALPKDDLGPENLRRIIEHLFDAKSVSKRLGRYYVSLLVLWVQSLDWATVPVRKPSSKKGKKDLISLIMSREFRSLLGDVVGLEYVYFAMMNRVFGEVEAVPPYVRNSVKSFIRANKKMMMNIERVPVEILDRRVCDLILREASRPLFGL